MAGAARQGTPFPLSAEAGESDPSLHCGGSEMAMALTVIITVKMISAGSGSPEDDAPLVADPPLGPSRSPF
jgi:hypothetical protein